VFVVLIIIPFFTGRQNIANFNIGRTYPSIEEIYLLSGIGTDVKEDEYR
jgi:hypothetical protein